jgi:capsular exopolysaccharide synthesis family protein
LTGRRAEGSKPLEFAHDYPLCVWSSGFAHIAESFRATVASIVFAGQSADGPRVLLFASPRPQEGKTAALCNVAVALGRIGRRVVVVDGDLRKPSLHWTFRVPTKFGLSNLLKMDALTTGVVSKGICPTQFSNVSVMSCGSGVSRDPEMLHSWQMSEVIDYLREQFDLVLVDSPPVLEVPDARVLGRLADAVVLVIRAHVTDRTSAMATRQRFADDGIPVLGTILNAWNPPGRKLNLSYGAAANNGISEVLQAVEPVRNGNR